MTTSVDLDELNAQEARLRKPIPPGTRFGKLTVLGFDHTVGKQSRYQCRCDCKKRVIVAGDSLRKGHTRSCGCLHAEKAAERLRAIATTHGMSHTNAYQGWISMVRRCTDPNHADWPRYGGRGITVCEDWLAFEGWWDHVRSLPGCPYDDRGNRVVERTSQDRIDNDAGYQPGNMRWATDKEQAKNRRPRGSG